MKDTIIETFKLDRDSVDTGITKLEELVHDRDVRRIVVKNASALLPVWAAIGAVAALAADFTIQVERNADETHT